MQTLAIPALFDAHVHLRNGELMQWVLPHTTDFCKYAVVMPNLSVPIETGVETRDYREEIMNACEENTHFELIMTVYLKPYTNIDVIEKAWSAGCRIGKLYADAPAYKNETDETAYRILDPIFQRMSELGMILSIHGEMPNRDGYKAERAFLPTLERIATTFPNLKIILEHVSTKEAVWTVESLSLNVAATITVHHLFLSWDDVYELDRETIKNPHNFCKPYIHGGYDRRVLITSAVMGKSKFFFGSDTAPHRRQYKECPNPRPGVYSPLDVALPTVVEIFEREGFIRTINKFLFENGANFYGLDINSTRPLKLEKKSWQVPDNHEGIVPFRSNQTLSWQIVK